MKKISRDLLILMLGSFLFALAVNVFIIPNELGEGGVTGVTIILYYLFQWSPGLMNLIINALLLLFGYRFLDRQLIVYTIIAVLFNSLFLHLTRDWSIASNEIIVNAIFGGVLTGIGIGIIIQVGGSTAGTTILARIANKYLDWNISYALLFFDLIVVFASYFIIGAERLMLTIIMLYVATKVMDFIIEGLNPKKAVTIISNYQDQIAERVTLEMDRGVTVLQGKGYYSKEAKEVLYIVITKQELPSLKKIVKATDADAFLTIHDVRDVFGEGFMKLSK
ncbi:YitT family protein [Paenibacillus sp. PAMC21692]|nr:YitT family protein [Paenibacillus sp. PAMC21692]QNK60884.1 YitT family protein [Paenibacillus sp. PAMC21692]